MVNEGELLVEMPGIGERGGGHFSSTVETQCSGKSTESISVTLAKTREHGWPSSVTRQGLRWRDWDRNPATNPLTYSLTSCRVVWDQSLASSSSFSSSSKRSEKLYSVTDRRRCKVPQPNIGRALGVLLRRGRNDCRSKREETTQTGPKESTDWSQSGLTEQRACMGLTYLCVGLYFCGTPKSKSRDCL